MSKDKLTKILDAADIICGECAGTEEDCNNCAVREICDNVRHYNSNSDTRSYCVTLLVTGYYTAHVFAKDADEAGEIAIDAFENEVHPDIENTEITTWETIEEE